MVSEGIHIEFKMFFNINYLPLLVLLAAIFFDGNQAEDCVDKKHNFIVGSSDSKKPNEVMVHDLGGVIYTENKRPSCSGGRPTIPMPGIVKFLQGKLTVPRKYDLIKSGVMKMTVKTPNFEDPLCLNGVSQYVIMPDKFCKFQICTFIGDKLCEFLSTPGVHTFEEMEKKIGFNRTQILPEPPSIFGISLLDLFSGEFSFGFTLEHEEKVILEVQIPTNDKYLQIGVDGPNSRSDNDNDNDDDDDNDKGNDSGGGGGNNDNGGVISFTPVTGENAKNTDKKSNNTQKDPHHIRRIKRFT